MPSTWVRRDFPIVRGSPIRHLHFGCEAGRAGKLLAQRTFPDRVPSRSKLIRSGGLSLRQSEVLIRGAQFAARIIVAGTELHHRAEWIVVRAVHGWLAFAFLNSQLIDQAMEISASDA